MCVCVSARARQYKYVAENETSLIKNEIDFPF